MFLKLDDTTNTKQNKQYTINSGLLLGGNIVIFFGSTAPAPRRAILMFQCTTVLLLKKTLALLYGWLPNPWPYTGRNFFMTQTFGGNPINIFLHSHMISPAQMLSRKGNQYWFLSSTRVCIEKKMKPIVQFQDRSSTIHLLYELKHSLRLF